jgi:hypothetical protein
MTTARPFTSIPFNSPSIGRVDQRRRRGEALLHHRQSEWPPASSLASGFLPDRLRRRRHGDVLVPMASVMALMTAGGAAIAPGLAAALDAERIGRARRVVRPTWNDGRSSARGMV